eukprot:CAMPEP_0180786170 /NCGR_PEP_ID=MMETSP1038_2-20121128/50647_1 /TAXON_ID=632150 /ORGANISM="Azadinium spinosum, Strain 3D9" /LENGTH=51 /DNA_ID=CAMNT_0022823253 /DNA_START=90 /DNA_END=242 /DNA_ORIENTATION=-
MTNHQIADRIEDRTGQALCKYSLLVAEQHHERLQPPEVDLCAERVETQDVQ